MLDGMNSVRSGGGDEDKALEVGSQAGFETVKTAVAPGKLGFVRPSPSKSCSNRAREQCLVRLAEDICWAHACEFCRRPSIDGSSRHFLNTQEAFRRVSKGKEGGQLFSSSLAIFPLPPAVEPGERPRGHWIVVLVPGLDKAGVVSSSLFGVWVCSRFSQETPSESL